MTVNPLKMYESRLGLWAWGYSSLLEQVLWTDGFTIFGKISRKRTSLSRSPVEFPSGSMPS